jgi:hypothetical protein
MLYKTQRNKKNAVGASSLFKRACRRDSEFRSGSDHLRRESQGEQNVYERGMMQDKAAGDVPAMTLPLGRPPWAPPAPTSMKALRLALPTVPRTLALHPLLSTLAEPEMPAGEVRGLGF